MHQLNTDVKNNHEEFTLALAKILHVYNTFNFVKNPTLKVFLSLPTITDIILRKAAKIPFNIESLNPLIFVLFFQAPPANLNL